MYDGMNLYRAIVSYSSATTGDIQVRIPAVLGVTEVIAVSKIGRAAVSGTWQVPLIGSQVVVAVEDDRFSNVYMVYPNLAVILESGGGGGEEPPPEEVQYVPSGSIMQFAGASVPSGWLLCNGDPVSRTTYANLFTAIGTTYGVGNGTTTFNLPNLKGKVPVGRDSSITAFNTLNNQGGAATRTIAVANLPAHNHGLNSHTHTISHGHTASGSGGSHNHTATSSGGFHGHTGSATTTGSTHNHAVQTGSALSIGAGNGLFANSGFPPVTSAGNVSSSDGGSHSHTVSVDNSFSHDHTISVGLSDSLSITVTVGGSNTANSGQATGNTADTGSGTALETMSPYIVVNYIIKV